MRDRSFDFSGRRYRYRVAVYNATWTNERAVELPIALEEVAAHPDARVVEVGNVLAHYGVSGHRVVDRYEAGADVCNVDFDAWSPRETFDLLVSISTFEHMGRDETPRDDDKALRAFEKIPSLLRPTGRALVTFPVGWNPALDRAAAERDLRLGRLAALRRVNRDNEWAEVTIDVALEHGYGETFPFANAIIVCRIDPSRSTTGATDAVEQDHQ